MVVPKMKSKSQLIGHGQADPGKQKRVFDFVQLYTNPSNASASGSGGLLPNDSHQLASPNVKSESVKCERSPHKGKKIKRGPVDISDLKIDDPSNSSVGGSALNTPRVTSTPLPDRKDGKSKVKSIMKHSSANTNDTTVDTDLETSSTKPKKRNKSVSFMLEEQEEFRNKKTKSEESTDNSKTDVSLKVKRKFKKTKKSKLAEKENLVESNQQTVETPVKDRKREKNKDSSQQTLETPIKERVKEKKKKFEQSEKSSVMDVSDPIRDDSQVENTEQTKKKHKKEKKVKTPKPTEEGISEPVNQEVTEKTKKPKKKKHQDKPNFESEEPVSKSRKKELQPDVVADLENLSIGDNAHTLTNLLDEMTIVDKNKRKKLKHKTKNKKPKGDSKSTSESKSTPETSIHDDAQEKVKWMRRKWNKEHKGDKENVDNTVVVENVPMSLLLSYKKVLAEHYVKYGLVRSVGIAEMYPSKVSAPVFTTTVHFYSDGAATEALSDEWMLEGRPIKVRRSLPPTSTTVVVRSYGALNEAAITSALHAAGPIRDIRRPVKGRHTIATFFVELDGPASVENALRLATDLKIAGKKVYVSKFEDRPKKEKQPKPSAEASDADHSDSQDNS